MLFRSSREYFRHAENYFRHVDKLHTSQHSAAVTGNPVCAHTRNFTMAAPSRAFGPDRAVPGIKSTAKRL